MRADAQMEMDGPAALPLTPRARVFSAAVPEHVKQVANHSEPSGACGELDFMHSQFCVDGWVANSSVFAPGDKQASSGERHDDDFLVLCDTDFVGPRAADGPSLRPLSFTTAVSKSAPFADAFPGLGGSPPKSGYIDLPCAFANTLLRPLVAHVPAFGTLADELFVRHEAIVSGHPQGTTQLSWSCMYAWLCAAVNEPLKSWVRTQMPSSRMQLGAV